MLYITVAIILIAIQMIYISGTDIPFYYKEIIYDWNYTTNTNKKFHENIEWIHLLHNKGVYNSILNENDKSTWIQTDLFSQQQYTNVHEHINKALLVLASIIFLYLIYTSINAVLYKHEKQKVNNIIVLITVTLGMIIYLYNTELLISILYKTHFVYTDNIYINNEKETTAKGIIILMIGSIFLYIRKRIKEQIKKASRYYIYILLAIVNIINENTIIGVEYLYFFIYVEMLIIAMCLFLNIKK